MIVVLDEKLHRVGYDSIVQHDVMPAPVTQNPEISQIMTIRRAIDIQMRAG